MKYLSKTNQELLEEISNLKQRIKELEQSESKLSQSENALLESREQYRSLVDNINFGINLINKDFRIITTNIVSGRQFNKPASELVGKYCFEEFEKRQAVCEHCPGVLAMATGRVHQVDTEGVRDDGSRFLARIYAFPLFYPDGKVRGFNEVVEDITERRQTENKLRDQEEKYKALFNNAEVALFRTRAHDGKLLAANKRFVEKAGYSNIEECMAEFNAVKAWVDPNERNILLKILQEKRAVHDYETEIARRDGTRIWISFSATFFPEQGILEGSIVDITARKHAEAVVKDNEKKFAATFYKSPIPMAITSIKDGRYLDVNESFMKTMGYKYEELIGNSSTGAGYITSESRALFLEEYNQKGIVENLELEMRVKDGELRRGLFNSSKITIDSEDFFLTMVTDITELRRIEEELRQSEAMLSIVFKAAPIGICVLKNYILMSANDEWLKNSGYSEDEVIGRDTRHLYESEEEYNRVSQEVRKSLSKNGFASVQTTQRRKDGSIRDVILTVVPLQTKDIFNKIFVITVQDITERRRAEQELVWKTALLEAQVESTIDGILIIDNNGKKILANQQLLNIWKVPQNIRDDKDGIPLLKYIKSLTKFPKKFLEKVTYLYDHPDETSRDEIEFENGMVLDRYSSPVLGKDGKHYGRIWIYRDITDRKQEEEERLRLEKLQGVLEMAGAICHEMNQPMQIISGLSELLTMSVSENDPVKEKIKIINEQVGRMAAITKKLMTIEDYETQDYAGVSRIVDINKSSSKTMKD